MSGIRVARNESRKRAQGNIRLRDRTDIVEKNPMNKTLKTNAKDSKKSRDQHIFFWNKMNVLSFLAFLIYAYIYKITCFNT